ncbi:MAG: CHASE2 domain-containing protein [Isosphaeraceae bacterium]
MPFRFRLPFSDEVRKNLIALVLISLFVLLLEHWGWLAGFENTALDSFLLASRSRPSKDIYIVDITEDDYRDMFRSRSPLNAAEIQRILTLIQQAGPSVIAVDLDTSSSEYGNANLPDAVWARDVLSDCEQDANVEATDKERPHPEAKGLRRLRFLGGHFSETEKSGRIETTPRSGLSLFPLDRDGVVRRYRTAYFSDQADPPSSRKGLVDSFPQAVLIEYKKAKRANGQKPGESLRTTHETPSATDHGEEGLILNFSGDRYDFPRMSLRQLKQAAEKPFWSKSSPLRGRIVLVGGTYRAARDLYFTPVGPRHGVEITAQAIQSELSGGGVRPLNHGIAILVDLLAGIGLIWLNQTFHGGFVLLINALFIMVTSLLGSYLAFDAFVYWFNFTAVLVSLWIHVLWEHLGHARQLGLLPKIWSSRNGSPPVD